MANIRTIAIGLSTVAVIVTAFVLSWSAFQMRSDAQRLIDRGPAIPTPSASDAAAVQLSAGGNQLTIKQRSSAWLPGGKLKLHLDDITDGQVLVSATDEAGHVVLGPQSMRENDQLTLSNMKIRLLRLKNITIGSGDFGEFEVLPLQ